MHEILYIHDHKFNLEISLAYYSHELITTMLIMNSLKTCLAAFICSQDLQPLGKMQTIFNAYPNIYRQFTPWLHHST
jgi:hypothetical protein